MRSFQMKDNRRKMNWKIILTNVTTKLNNLSRSRKIILFLFALLIMVYYIVPKLLGSHSSYLPKGVTLDLPVHGCLAGRLEKYHKDLSNFDAVINYVPRIPGYKNYPPYVGNGYVAVSLENQNGMHIRLNKALSLPINYYPVVTARVEGTRKEEVDVLHLRRGLATRLTSYITSGGCVFAESQVYAHRSWGNLLMQRIRLINPTSRSVTVELDQVRESGWTDSTTTQDSAPHSEGSPVQYTVTSGVVRMDPNQDLYLAVTAATTTVGKKQISLDPGESANIYVRTIVHYGKAGSKENVLKEIDQLKELCKQELPFALKTQPKHLKLEHVELWEKLWTSGFSISPSKAEGVLNGDKINSTIYYVLSNTPAPLHSTKTPKEVAEALQKTLHYPDKCYSGHTSLHSTTLWVDPVDEDGIASVVTTWMLTLEKQGCQNMILAGVEGVLQSMLLSIGSLQFGKDHLEMNLQPKDTHRDFNFHRINYGNNTHLNISVLVGDDNKANIYVALDRNDRPYYACDAGCLDPPVPLSNIKSKFPVKLTEPLTSILYITADRVHMEEYRHTIHVKEIVEAPAHEHHVIALHKHGHHFGGLPTIFWVSIAFLIIVFHLFLFKLIYNEYCTAQERFTRSRYNV